MVIWESTNMYRNVAPRSRSRKPVSVYADGCVYIMSATRKYVNDVGDPTAELG